MTGVTRQHFALPGVALAALFLCDAVYGQLTIGWTRQFGSQNGNEADGVSVGTDGVYVAGSTVPDPYLGTSSEAFVTKYDFAGGELWTNVFGTQDEDRAKGVSSAADGVYVAGYTFGTFSGPSTGYQNAFVRKYDPNGSEVWTRQFGSVYSTAAYGVSAASDGVYVAGSAVLLPGQVNSGARDAFLRKYDLNGNELWTRQFGSVYDDAANGVSAASDGVYVVGVTYLPTVPGYYKDAFIRKYDQSGKELWTRYRESDASYQYVATAVRATADAVYVAGSYSSVPGLSAVFGGFLSKYDPNGNELWTRQFSGNQEVHGVSANTDGVYVAGLGVYAEIGFVLQYGALGNLIGAPQWGGPPLLSTDATGGRVYAAGYTGHRYAAGSYAFLEMLVSGPNPASHVTALPAVEFGAEFPVQWSGTDNGGPGIQDYTVYVSDNGSPFNQWLTQTTATQATFTGASGHTYGFYSIARDLAGKIDGAKSAGEATTYLDAVKPVSHVSALPAAASSPNFLVQWSGTDSGGPGIGKYNIYVSDNGGGFNLWQANTTATQAWYSGYLGHTYGFFSQATDSYGVQEITKSAAEATTQVPAHMAQDVNGDGQINCADLKAVKAALGTRPGQTGWNPAADVNGDGVIDVRDVASVSQKLAPGTTCN